jgi:hypothetical protein
LRRHQNERAVPTLVTGVVEQACPQLSSEVRGILQELLNSQDLTNTARHYYCVKAMTLFRVQLWPLWEQRPVLYVVLLERENRERTVYQDLPKHEQQDVLYTLFTRESQGSGGQVSTSANVIVSRFGDFPCVIRSDTARHEASLKTLFTVPFVGDCKQMLLSAAHSITLQQQPPSDAALNEALSADVQDMASGCKFLAALKRLLL